MIATSLSSVRDFFRVWFYWKYQAICIFFVIIFAVLIYIIVSPPLYVANAKILILPHTTEGFIISSGSEVKTIDKVSREDINTEIELLNSEDVLRATVRSLMQENRPLRANEPDRAWYSQIVPKFEDAFKSILQAFNLKPSLSDFDANVKFLKNAVEIEPVSFSDIITINLKNEDAQQAAFLLNRLLKTYIQHHNEVFSKDDSIAFFNDQAKEYQHKLDKTEKELKSYQSRWQILDIKSQYKTLIDQIAQLNQDLKRTEVLLAESKSKLGMLHQSIASDLKITKEMRFIPAIVELEKALVPLYVERSSILKSYTKSSREYRNIGQQIATIHEQIKREIKRAIKTEQLEIKSLEAKQASLNNIIAHTYKDADELLQKERHLNALERNVSILKDNYLLYASKTEDARIFAERKKRNLANVSIAQHANVPTTPSFSNKFLLLLASIFIAFFAASGAPFILEFLDHRIKTSYEVEKILCLPVICTLPEITRKNKNKDNNHGKDI